MITNYSKFARSRLPSVFIFCCVVMPAQAQEGNENTADSSSEARTNMPFDLVQGSEDESSNSLPSGTLLLPDSLRQTGKEEKKCMTVCARWGEDCTYVNRGVGGMTRSCRRSCQQFTEECF